MYRSNGQGNPLAIAAQPVANGTPISQYVAAPQLPVQPAQPIQQPVQQPIAQQPVQPQQPVAQPSPFYAPGTPVGAAPQQPVQPQAAQQPIQPEPAQYVAVQQGQPAAERAATIQEIEANCPGAPADFVLQMQKQNATVRQAQAAFIAFQGQQLTRQQPQVPQYAPTQQQAPVQQPVQYAQPAQVPNYGMPGNQPVQPEPAATVPAINAPGGAKQYYDQLVKQKQHMYVTAGMNGHEAKLQAVRDLETEQPGLREQAFGLASTPLPGTVPVIQGPAPYPQAQPPMR